MFGSFPPSPVVVCASKLSSGLGADIVYGIISLKMPPGTRGIPQVYLSCRDRYGGEHGTRAPLNFQNRETFRGRS